MAQIQTGTGSNRDTNRSSVGQSGTSSSMGSDTSMSSTGARGEDSKFNAAQITDALKNVDVKGKMNEIRDRSREYVTEGERYIRSNPIPVVLSAAGVGFILGFLMRRH